MPVFSELAGRIIRHPFFAGLSEKHLAILADAAMPAEFSPGETIFRAGDPANRFYLIEEGRVLLESRGPDGMPARLQSIEAGDVLGWSWMIPPYVWNFDARAEVATRAVFLYATRLREECEEDHDFGFEMLKRIAPILLARLQSTRRQLVGKGEGTTPAGGQVTPAAQPGGTVKS